MKRHASGTLALVPSMAGCSSEAPVEVTQGNELGGEQTASKSYPYVGEHGEFVCAETEIVVGDERIVEREFYHLDVMNNGLSGRDALDAAGVALMNEAGLSRVETCDDARRFIVLQREYEQSQLPPDTFTPPVADRVELPDAAGDTDIDKVADGDPARSSTWSGWRSTADRSVTTAGHFRPVTSRSKETGCRPSSARGVALRADGGWLRTRPSRPFPLVGGTPCKIFIS